MTIPTVSRVIDRIPAGIDPDSLAGDLIRRATAPVRAHERTRAALWGALVVATEGDAEHLASVLGALAVADDLGAAALAVHAADVEHGDGSTLAQAAGVLIATLHGTGGPLGAGGPCGASAWPVVWPEGVGGTRRRQAVDGAAWMAAIRYALEIIESLLGRATLVPHGDGVAVRLGRAEPVVVVCNGVERELCALARAVVLSVAGLSGTDLPAPFEGGLEAWATCLDQAEYLVEAIS